ncbi:MAG TPA: hypothetical protein VEM76_20820 [Anaeromyxobacteraceae bacterium]|nr:hypothetical protein [Anaeromyxobacteraceae bacterium]
MRLTPYLAAVSVLACVHQRELVPAPGAQTLPGKPRVAEETVEGARVQVDSAAWGNGQLYDVLSPVKVTIDNGSGRPLRVAYGEFTLGGPSGFRLAALPPYQAAAVDAAAGSVGVPPGFVGSGFLVAPARAHLYRGILPWHGPFPYDPVYYNRWYGAWPASLPNEELLRQGLPEGVLQPGGHLSGFLYFKDQPKGTALTFYASLVDAEKGESFGTVAIPFTVK